MSRALDIARIVDLTVKRQPEPTRTMRGHTGKVEAVAFFKDSRRVVTGSHDKTLRIWDLQNGALIGGPFEGHRGGVLSIAVSPDDRQIASGGKDNTIIIWDVEGEQKAFSQLMKHAGWVNSVCFSPDGKRLASGAGDDMIVLWDAKGTGAVLATCPHCLVFSVAFSPDGLKLASGSTGTIRIWRADNAELLLEINAHESYVRSVVWSPDGQQLVSASLDTTIKFWDSSNGDQVHCTASASWDWVRSLAISFDGSFIATISDDKTVRLWSTKTYHQIGHALEHTKGVYCAAISPNGELVVSGDREGKVLLWSIEDTLSAAIQLYSSRDSFFAHRSKVNLRRNLYQEALHDAEKVVELDSSSHIGYELKYAALHGAQRYDDAIEAFKFLLSILDHATDVGIQKLRRNYVSLSEVEDAIRQAIHTQLDNAPLRLFNTFTGRLSNRDAQINTFMESTEYKEILSSSVAQAPLQMQPINEAVEKYFSWVMLSHRWENKEPLLHDIQDKVVYDLDPVGTIVKLQTFCKISRDAGYRWAWSDTCCIDQNNNVELQRSVNSMFVWYRHSALTIVYLSDVPPSAKSGALANSAWNTRGWTVQEFLAPNVVLFYQKDWTLYLQDSSRNHKESATIMHELEKSTGINAQALVAFRPDMAGAREKLRWASKRVTTWQEDVAYSLFGIFGVHLPVIYGEKKHNALGRLLQEIIAQSGDITALDWVGKSSEFNSCLPADITSYAAPPCTLPSLPEDEIQMSVSSLRDTAVIELALKLYTLLDNLSAPRFDHRRLHLPCIAFVVAEVRRRRGTGQEPCSTYEVKAEGLQDLYITTADELPQFSQARATQRVFLLVRPWNRYDLGLPDFVDDTESLEYWSDQEPPLDNSPSRSPGEHELVDLESHSRALRLIVRLGQPFGALLLAQQRGGEYKRIASDQNIIARVKDMNAVRDMMGVRTLDIL